MEPLHALSEMPALLARIAAQFPAGSAARRSGPFALVEHVWHLADLEVEGFGSRITRLLAEPDPYLPDFDGQRAALDRGYLLRTVDAGLTAFSIARNDNLQRLHAARGSDWTRSGEQEGVGRVYLSDLPRRMLEHDRAHLGEIADLVAELAPGHALIDELRAIAHGAKTSKAA